MYTHKSSLASPARLLLGCGWLAPSCNELYLSVSDVIYLGPSVLGFCSVTYLTKQTMPARPTRLMVMPTPHFSLLGMYIFARTLQGR